KRRRPSPPAGELLLELVLDLLLGLFDLALELALGFVELALRVARALTDVALYLLGLALDLVDNLTHLGHPPPGDSDHVGARRIPKLLPRRPGGRRRAARLFHTGADADADERDARGAVQRPEGDADTCGRRLRGAALRRARPAGG